MTEIIKKLGGFDEQNLTEDQEIAYHVQKEDYKIKHCFDGYVYTTAPGTINKFYRQRKRWYQGSISCLHKYRGIIFNRKYGDFSFIQLTKNILGFILAFSGLFFSFYFIVIPIYQKFRQLYLLDFDLLTLLKNAYLHFNIFTLEFRKVFIFIALITITVTFFYLAHKNANEKMRKHGIFYLIPYFAFYYLLKGSIFIISLGYLTLGKKTKW